ncbi:ATP-binding cassette domain-containing protein [Streptacidiphilus jiangxiensis]|uniref:ABC-type multidrug transport system, ATPase component n=1 Tax=Streptacidiphilus jiangxiensis TaxID=235985 RepID=A0A1H7JQP6_STRJI|nr:ABC transporter ATP-binding protein [Streptacidiphilus jiangxiensis]SEK76167.1 ABC-type multidrug transport system, ATPase component [Streptacidiphilus jiangxiensis]
MRLDGVGKRYGPRGPWVVREVGVEVARGVLVRASGGNGSGKSTLLRLLAGVTRPTRGRIVDGYARRAYVPERFAAELPFTAREYLRRLGPLHGLRADASVSRADELLERFGAAGYADQPLRELSKGSCQKVAVAQALLGEPELLVLDEAWTGLDRAARETLDAAVLERVADGAAVVFVDHDPARLAGLAEVGWSVAEGRVRVDEPDGSRPRRAAITITVHGLAASWLGGLTGVLEVVARGDGSVRLGVAAEASDDVLRAVLSRPGAHVQEVRA